MGKLYKIFVLFVLLSISSVDNTYSQAAEVSNGYNPLSLRQVHESYLMWKKTLWRRVDLKEKQNKPFFARNREISKIPDIEEPYKLAKLFVFSFFIFKSYILIVIKYFLPIFF